MRATLGFLARFWQVILAAMVAVQVAALLAMGRPVICKCGVKLWGKGGINGESSQHVMDWYTPSHVIHGMLFYFAVWFLRRDWPVTVRLLAAAGLEIAWEIFENTPMVIERYRDATAAVDYRGDTVLNSVSDVGFMLLGFMLALKLPAKWVIVLALGFELLAAWAVRDNLTLQVVTFLWPIGWLVDWQAAA